MQAVELKNDKVSLPDGIYKGTTNTMTTDEYIVTNATESTTGRRWLLPDPYWDAIPADIRAELVERYGQPATIDRGETAYWTIDDYATIAAR